MQYTDHCKLVRLFFETEPAGIFCGETVHDFYPIKMWGFPNGTHDCPVKMWGFRNLSDVHSSRSWTCCSRIIRVRVRV